MTKKRIIAIELVMLILVSSVVVYVNFDKFENYFSQHKPVAAQNPPLEEDEVIDPITEKVIELMEQLDEPMLLSYLERIVSFGPHPTARRFQAKIFDLPIEKVARYLYNEFQSMGLQVRYHEWEQELKIANYLEPKYYPGWLVGKNIEAILPGTDKNSDEIYIVTAHYDSWPGSVGANDDGSGIVTILSMAKIMSQYSFNHTLCFLLVDGEEQGLYGSKFYAKECKDKNKNIVATINIEDFGFHETEEGSKKIHSIENDDTCWITETISDNRQQYYDQVNLEEVVPLRVTKGYTADYLKFREFGYDAVCIWEYEWDYHRHTPGDTIETMDIPYLKKGARLLLATFAEWAWDVKSE